MADPMLCPECGTPLAEGHIVCQKCGLLLPVEYRESAFIAKIGLSQSTAETGVAPGALAGRLEHDLPRPGDLFPAENPENPDDRAGTCEACGESRDTRCAVCGRPLCPDHVLHCGVCKKTFCRDHIRTSCSLCRDYVCQDCLFHCPSCDRIMGADHLLACSHCGQVNCEECMTRTGLVIKKNYCKTCSGLPVQKDPTACEECGEMLGESRGSRCSACGKRLCPDHTVPCSVCHKPFCREHIHRACSLCDNYVCPDCLLRCPRCDSVVGADHLHECAECGQVICKNCVSEVGIFVKRKYCRDRCEPTAEEIEKEGFFSGLIKNR